MLHDICIRENDLVEIEDFDDDLDEGPEDSDDENATNKRNICGML